MGEDGQVTTVSALVRSVDDEFARSSAVAPWANPHAHRDAADDEYERLTDAAKWRILGERVDAWFAAIERAGFGSAERDVDHPWVERPGPIVSRTDRMVPKRVGALSIAVGRSRLGDVDEAGLVLGLGSPASCVAILPDCGCDACDHGSADALELLDRYLRGIVAGTYRRLTRRHQAITTIDGDGWSARNMASRRRLADKVADVLADPTGWDEISGRSWLT